MRGGAFFLLFLASALPAQEKLKTVIKGARMEVLKKGEVAEFKGGVTLTRGNDFMSARRMINMEKEGVTQAWGDVYLKRRDPERGVLWEAWGDEGYYDSKASSGTLKGRVFMEVRQSSPTASLTRVWADRACYDAAGGALLFDGAPARKGPRARAMPPWPKGVPARPRVVQKDAEGARDLWGERVTYFESDGRLAVEGAVRVFWEGKDVLAR